LRVPDREFTVFVYILEGRIVVKSMITVNPIHAYTTQSVQTTKQLKTNLFAHAPTATMAHNVKTRPTNVCLVHARMEDRVVIW